MGRDAPLRNNPAWVANSAQDRSRGVEHDGHKCSFGRLSIVLPRSSQEAELGLTSERRRQQSRPQRQAVVSGSAAGGLGGSVRSGHDNSILGPAVVDRVFGQLQLEPAQSKAHRRSSSWERVSPLDVTSVKNEE